MITSHNKLQGGLGILLNTRLTLNGSAFSGFNLIKSTYLIIYANIEQILICIYSLFLIVSDFSPIPYIP